MKSLIVPSLILLFIVGCFFGYLGIKNIQKAKKIESIKTGWYIEIIYDDPINVRKKPKSSSESIGLAKKGEVYKALDVNTDNDIYYWYLIEYGEEKGWIASKRKKPWVNDVNNPTDIAVPQIKFYDNIYKVISIEDISYKHLEIVEDTDKYTITHEVYHEVKPSEMIDQYWIKYTVTDGAGKSSSKVQKIEFDIKPEESQVLDFSKMDRK